MSRTTMEAWEQRMYESHAAATAAAKPHCEAALDALRRALAATEVEVGSHLIGLRWPLREAIGKVEEMIERHWPTEEQPT